MGESSKQSAGIGSIFISIFSILHALATFLFVRKPFPFSLIPIKVWIPPATREKMKRLGVSEQQVMQVFHHGKHKISGTGRDTMTMNYVHYKIGLYYLPPSVSGEYKIIAVWKDPI